MIKLNYKSINTFSWRWFHALPNLSLFSLASITTHYSRDILTQMRLLTLSIIFQLKVESFTENWEKNKKTVCLIIIYVPVSDFEQIFLGENIYFSFEQNSWIDFHSENAALNHRKSVSANFIRMFKVQHLFLYFIVIFVKQFK